MGPTYPLVGTGATGRHHVALAARAVRASTLAIVLTSLTIASPLPASSTMAATAPVPASSGTLRPVAMTSDNTYWYAINDSDQAAGIVSASGNSKPVRWDN